MTTQKSDLHCPRWMIYSLHRRNGTMPNWNELKDIPLYELHPFKDHPFKIQNNEEMKRLIESIKKVWNHYACELSCVCQIKSGGKINYGIRALGN